jgi:hypothetical protein
MTEESKDWWQSMLDWLSVFKPKPDPPELHRSRIETLDDRFYQLNSVVFLLVGATSVYLATSLWVEIFL